MSTSTHARSSIVVVGALFFQAVGCGVDPDIAWRERTERQLAEIRTGERDALYNPHPAMLESLARDADIAASLSEVCIWADASSPDFEALADFPNLTSIVVYDVRGADGFMKHVLACGKISDLSINQTDLSDEGLATISRIDTLQHLGINAWPDRLSTQGLNRLESLQGLKTLQLRLGPSEPDLQALRAALPNCRIELEVEQ